MKWLLYLTILLMPWLKPELPYNLDYVDGVMVLFMFLILLAVLARHIKPRFFLWLPMAVILASGIISALASPTPGHSMVAVAKEVALFAWFLAVVSYVRERALLHSLVRFWLLTTWLMGLLVAVAPFLLRSYSYFFYSIGPRAIQTRVVGLFHDPNMAANYLLLGSLVGLAFPPFRSRAGQVLFQVTLWGGGVIATGSNGGLGAAVAGWTIYLFLYSWRHFTVPAGRAAWASSCVLVVLGATFYAAAMPPDVSQVVAERAEGSHLTRIERSMQLRKGMIADALAMYAASPLMGVGPGNTIASDGSWSAYPHNDFLAKLAENGPLGLSGYLALLTVMFVSLLRLRKLLPESSPVYFGLAAAFAANLVHSLSIQTFHFRHVWLLYALILLVSQFEGWTRVVSASGSSWAVPRRATSIQPDSVRPVLAAENT